MFRRNVSAGRICRMMSTEEKAQPAAPTTPKIKGIWTAKSASNTSTNENGAYLYTYARKAEESFAKLEINQVPIKAHTWHTLTNAWAKCGFECCDLESIEKAEGEDKAHLCLLMKFGAHCSLAGCNMHVRIARAYVT